MYEYLKTLLTEKAAADEPVMVILDSFEQFAQENHSSKQLLLYNLLDWLQVCCCRTRTDWFVGLGQLHMCSLLFPSPRISKWASLASATTST